MKRSRRVLLVFVSALVAFLLWGSSCKSIERAAKSTGAGWSVALLVLFTPAPWLAIPVAAFVGHVGGTVQAGDDIQEEATKAAEKVVTKYVDREVVKWRDREVTRFVDVIPWWAWCIAIYVAIQWLLRLIAPRARHQLLRSVWDLVRGRVLAALARLGAAEGVVHTDTAERLSERAEIRRRDRLARSSRKGGGGDESAPGKPAGSLES